MASLKFLLLTAGICYVAIPHATDGRIVALHGALSKGVCKQMAEFKKTQSVGPPLKNKEEFDDGQCAWVHWAQCPSGKDCSSFEHKTCDAGGGGPGGGSGPGGGQPGGPSPEPPEECTDNPPEGGSGPEPPPVTEGPGGGGGSPPPPPPPPPTGGGGAGGSDGKIHIAGTLSKGICDQMKAYKSSKEIQGPLKMKAESGGGEKCHWYTWYQCESRGDCTKFESKTCEELGKSFSKD